MKATKKAKPIYAKDLQKAFYEKHSGSFETVIPNVFTECNVEMDLMCISKSNYVHEIEVKISKADFNNDFEKTHLLLEDNIRRKFLKHESIESGKYVANRFSFLIPEKLEDKVEIPEYAGLYVLTKYGNIVQRKKSKLLHKNKISIEEKYKLCRKITYRYWNKF